MRVTTSAWFAFGKTAIVMPLPGIAREALDREARRDVPVELAVQPERRDAQLAQPRLRVEAAASGLAHLVVDLRVRLGVAACSALAGEVLEEVVLVGRDRRAGEDDEEPDRALAEAASGVIQPAWLCPARPTRRGSIPGCRARKRAAAAASRASTSIALGGRRRARVEAGRLADAALVVGEHGHAVAEEQRLQVGQVGARRLARARDPRDRRVRRRAPAAPSASRRASRRRCGSAPRSTGRGRAPTPCRSRARRRRELERADAGALRRPTGADAVAGPRAYSPCSSPVSRLTIRAGPYGSSTTAIVCPPSGRGRRGPARPPTPARRGRRRRQSRM